MPERPLVSVLLLVDGPRVHELTELVAEFGLDSDEGPDLVALAAADTAALRDLAERRWRSRR